MIDLEQRNDALSLFSEHLKSTSLTAMLFCSLFLYGLSQCWAEWAACTICCGWSSLGFCAHGREAPHILTERAWLATMHTFCTLDERLDLDIRIVAVRAAMPIELSLSETSRATQSPASNRATRVFDGLRCFRFDLHQHLGLHVLVQNNSKLALANIKLCYVLVVLAQPRSIHTKNQQRHCNTKSRHCLE